VIVNPAANIPPVASAGANQTITLPTNTVSLAGSGTDADGTVVAYVWAKISGPSSYSISNSSAPGTTVTGLVQGSYSFKLTVTDNDGATASAVVQVTVNRAANIPPVANAGANQVVTLPINSVSLVGTGTDSDGTVVSYAWIEISGPSSASVANPSSPSTNVNGLVQGTYEFQLLVTDNNGATGKDTVQVSVNPAANIPPVAHVGPDQTITLPTDSIVLSGSGTDADGQVVSYKWTKISGPTAGSVASPASATSMASGMVKGIYQFELQVTDNSGAIGTATVQITVNAAPNIPPVANAGPNQTITLPVNSVILSGIGTDSDGAVTSYSWTKISGPFAGTLVNPSSASSSATGLVQGVYQFQLQVTDNSGATGTSIMQVTVNPPANIPPVANAGPDQNMVLPTNSVEVFGKGTDADGTVVGYQWSKISGPSTYNIVGSTSAATTINGLVEGIYEFELRVTDNDGARGRDTVTITVRSASTLPPSAFAGPDQVIILPSTNVSLAGSGEAVAGSIVNYLWTKISGPTAFNITNAGSPVTDVWNLVPGVYQFQLTVTDDFGLTGTDTMQVTVVDPTLTGLLVNAGPDQAITLPTDSITLTGIATDINGTITGYQWRQISGPTASVIAVPTIPVTSANGLIGGYYEYELTAYDTRGASAKDTFTVIVAEPRLNVSVSNSINLYPNPVQNITTLEINSSLINARIGIVITDMRGVAVYRSEIVSGVNTSLEKIDFSNLAKGMYIVTVFFDKKDIQTRKLLKL